MELHVVTILLPALWEAAEHERNGWWMLPVIHANFLRDLPVDASGRLLQEATPNSNLA